MWNLPFLLITEVKLKESEKRDEYLPRPRLRTEKTMEYESNGDTNCNWHAWYSHQRIDKETRGIGNMRTTGNHPNYSIIKIGQNT